MQMRWEEQPDVYLHVEHGVRPSLPLNHLIDPSSSLPLGTARHPPRSSIHPVTKWEC